MHSKVVYSCFPKQVQLTPHFESHLSGCMDAICIVVKPFQTRPAAVGTKGSSGFCVLCAATATTEALFKVEGAIIVQRYCDRCLSQANYEAPS